MSADPHADTGESGVDGYLETLSAAVLDGSPIDWEAEATGPAAAYLDEIRALESVVQLHRHLARLRASDTPRASSAPETPALGEWGALRILERIGGGAFGEVFRAWDRRLDRQVALKLLYPTALGDDQGTTVIAEGRLLARVRHPNVVTVFGAERIDGRVGIWTEFVDGRTLTDVVRQEGHLNAEAAIDIGVDLCGALSAVHAAGLVHGDVKADNVLRDSGGRTVLVDLGTGRDRLYELAVDGRRQISGTPLYMSPETWLGAEPTERSDVFSLGVLLYYLVTGTYPVRGATLRDIREAHAAGRQVSLRAQRAELPVAFRNAVDRALDPDPAARFASAEALRAALDRARPSTTRRRRVAAVGIAGASLVALVLAGIAYGVWTASPPTGRDFVTTSQLTFTVPETALLTSAISPDGKYLAYTALNGLFLQPLDRRVPVQLERPRDSDVSDLAFLPDSTTLLIAGTGGVWSLSAPDQVPRRVLDGAERVVVSPDGSLVALSRGAGGIWIATPDGERQWQVVEPQPNTTFGEPAWSPDGGRLAYPLHEQTSRGVRATVESRRLDGTAKTTIFDGRGVHQVVWTPDGRVLIARPLPPPRARYTNWWQVPVDTATGEPLEEARQITDFPDFNFTHPTLTADGRRLAFVRTRLRGDIVTADFDPDRPALIDLRRLVFTGTDTLPSSWTPSGDGLLFTADERLYRQDRGQTVAQEHLPSGAGRVSHAVVSPDGAWLLYVLDRAPAGNALMRVATSGGRAEPVDWHPHAIQMLRDTASTTAWLRCSRWPADVCVASDLVEGQLRLARVDPTLRTSEELGVLPASPSFRNGWDLSPDGSQVASLAVSDSSGRIVILDVATRAVRELSADWLGAAQSIAWRGDGRGWIVAIAAGAAGGEVLSVDISGSSTVIWQSPARRLWNPTVSPNGRSIVFSSLAVENDAWALEGF